MSRVYWTWLWIHYDFTWFGTDPPLRLVIRVESSDVCRPNISLYLMTLKQRYVFLVCMPLLMMFGWRNTSSQRLTQMPDHGVAHLGVSVLHTQVFMTWPEMRCNTHRLGLVLCLQHYHRQMQPGVKAFVMHGAQMDDILCCRANAGGYTSRFWLACFEVYPHSWWTSLLLFSFKFCTYLIASLLPMEESPISNE